MLLEGRADMEREFMNELATLSEQLMSMDRKFKNQILEKDFVIANLEEELRKARHQPRAWVGKSVGKSAIVTKL